METASPEGEGGAPRDPHSSTALDVCFRVGPLTDPSHDPRWILDCEAEPLATGSLPEIRKRLGSELHFAVASHARSALFVHAGTVGWKGRAILVPGRSMSGKTSLVRALVELGADYYSDEYAVLDAQGLVHPYPRPLSVRDRDGSGSTRLVAPEELGCRIGEAPLPVGLILKTHFVPDGPFEPKALGAARGLMALIDNTVLVRERSGFAMDRLEAAARGATTLEGPRGDAERAAQWILDHATWES